MLYFLLKFNNTIEHVEQIMILDLLAYQFCRFDLTAFDFSNEEYDFQKFDYFRQKLPIAIKFQHSV